MCKNKLFIAIIYFAIIFAESLPDRRPYTHVGEILFKFVQ